METKSKMMKRRKASKALKEKAIETKKKPKP
jgi:hypothetical protein